MEKTKDWIDKSNAIIIECDEDIIDEHSLVSNSQEG